MHTSNVVSPLLLAAPAALAQETGSGSCTDVHIFIARGWNEPYPGRHEKLVNDICTDVSGLSCGYEDIVYPAASSDYCNAVSTGSNNGKQQIEAYYAKCPNSKLVLSGYSQGANIIGDILTSGNCGSRTGLESASGASCNIAAALLFGDPLHQPNKPYNYLDGNAGQGTGGPRSQVSNQILESYTPRLRSYCAKDDLVCAPGLGADTVEAHTNYFDVYSQDAASWITELVNSFPKNGYCSASKTSSTSGTVTTSTSGISSTASASSSTTSSVPVATASSSSPSWSTSYANCTSTSSSPTTTDAGKPAVVISTTEVATTTLWNFPTLVITKASPVATSYIGSIGWSNGTAPTAPAGTGAGSWTSSTSAPSATPYTGAASGMKALGRTAGLVAAVALMML
ncbi:hypothetical protein CBER1_05621 [Cercospora berteroae]|uniref:Cutinase n=1 Tax=Cercospora berteroae TaxID=357750 RepID=A0A2S6CFK9_9PEZI|nr:hypothetical protein CBER1_05621 [Cercospora berteroae]